MLQKVANIQVKVLGCEELISPTRSLEMETPAHVRTFSNLRTTEAIHQLFLFNDMLLIAKEKLRRKDAFGEL